jgi:hypothetical protein
MVKQKLSNQGGIKLLFIRTYFKKMGGASSLFITKETNQLRVRLQRETRENGTEIINYSLPNSSNVPRSWTPNRFITVYIKLINVLVVNDKLAVTKRNVRGFILDFLNDFLTIGDTVSLHPSRYNHGRANELLFHIESLDIASEDNNRFFHHSNRPDLNLIGDYLTLVNNLLK